MKSKRLPAEKRKIIILKAAIDEFARYNYRLAKMPEIALNAGVTEPIVYRHFESKKNLFLEVLSVIGEKTVERLEQSVEDFDGDMIEKIELMLLNYLNSMGTYRKELKVYYQAISEFDDTEIKAVLDRTYSRYAQCVTAIVEEGKQRQQINSTVESNQFGWNLVGLLIHLSTFYLLEFYQHRSAQELINQHLSVLK